MIVVKCSVCEKVNFFDNWTVSVHFCCFCENEIKIRKEDTSK